MEEIRQILAGLDWSPLFISIKTGIAATIVSFFLGIWAARKVLKAKTGLRAVLDGILTLPLGAPADGCRIFPVLSLVREEPLDRIFIRHLISRSYSPGQDA